MPPYDNVPEADWDKMDRCVEEVMGKDSSLDKPAAVAICYSSIVEGKSLPLKFQLDEALKVGARNNSKDAERLQQIHDLSIANGATCPQPSGEITELPFMSLPDDALVTFGASVKAMGSGKVGGYLVRYGNRKDTDAESDYFDKTTEYGVTDGGSLPVYYDHGMDRHLKNRRIGRGAIKFDDVGLWVEAQLELRDEYEKAIYELAEKGKLGWSSGAAGHLVEKETVGKSNFIKSWPIAEASLTPTPAEPRNGAIPIKSLITQPDGGPVAGKEEPKQKPETLPVQNPERGIKMDFTQEDIKKLIADASAVAAAEAVKALANEPATKKAGVAVVEDEADRALKGNPFTFGTFHQAVANVALYGNMDMRLKPLKAASGLNETIPSQGGYLLQPQFATGIENKLYPAGNIMNKVRWIDLDADKNEFVVNLIDETSRADGSRFGGLLGYWLAEAATKTATKPRLRQVRVLAHKVAGLVYATDELLQDASALESYLGQAVPDELRFKIEAAIYGGDGVGKPLGWIESPSRKIIARDTASKVLATDVKQMWTALWPSCRATSQWYCGPDTESQLFALYEQTGIEFPFIRFSDAGVLSLFGRPVNVVEYSATLNTAGDIILVDPTQYLGVRKGGMQAASSIHVLFTTDESAFRYVMRVGGEDSWHSTLTMYGGSATLSDVVMLGSATATTT